LLISVITTSPKEIIGQNSLATNLAIPDTKNKNLELNLPVTKMDLTEISSANLVDLPVKEENKVSSDKPIDKFWHFVKASDKVTTALSVLANLLASYSMFSKGLSGKISKKVSAIADKIFNLSFISYGLDGIRIGIKNKNPFTVFGFALEMISVWLSDTDTKYLVRGAATGTDQIWVATDKKLEKVLPGKFAKGAFTNWSDGFKYVPQACWDLTKEIVANPVKTLFTLKNEGHQAWLSTLGDISATVGYLFTGWKEFFGPVRDAAGVIFDWAMILEDNILAKISGFFFVTESMLDFVARMQPKKMGLALNHLSFAANRIALMCYKASNPSS